MEKADKTQVIIGGLGGQGVVTAGVILGHAAILDGKNVVQTQNYGPEARGTGASSEVVISNHKIGYPKVLECDILVALSSGILKKHYSSLKPTAVLILDSNMIRKLPEGLKVKKIIRIPATELAEKHIGSQIYTNIIALGAILAHTQIVTKKSLRKAVEEHVPSKTLEENLNALQIGSQICR